MVERDFAFLIPNDLPTDQLMSLMKKTAGQLLQSVKVFDVYEGKGIKDGHRSVAFKLIYQDQEGTLGEEQLTEMQSKLIGALTKKFSIEVR